MNAAGTSVRVWPMPVEIMGKTTDYRAIDLVALREIVKSIKRFPDVVWGLENPTTRPDEGAERSARFGRQLGVIESFVFLHGFDYCLLAPALWKARLGLDGKTVTGANERAAKMFETFYPTEGHLVRGPRGGLKDGPLDALLIAHFLRSRGGEGIKSTVAKFGRDSAEVMALMLGGGRRKYKMNALLGGK